MKKIALMVLILCVMSGCQIKSDKKIITEDVIKELESREIKRVSNPELYTAAYSYTKTVRDSLLLANAELSKDFLKNKEITLEILSLDSALSEELSETKKAIIESYKYSLENDLPIGDNVTEFNEEELVYSDLINNPQLCESDSSCILLLFVKKSKIIQTM